MLVQKRSSQVRVLLAFVLVFSIGLYAAKERGESSGSSRDSGSSSARTETRTETRSAPERPAAPAPAPARQPERPAEPRRSEPAPRPQSRPEPTVSSRPSRSPEPQTPSPRSVTPPASRQREAAPSASRSANSGTAVSARSSSRASTPAARSPIYRSRPVNRYVLSSSQLKAGAPPERSSAAADTPERTSSRVTTSSPERRASRSISPLREVRTPVRAETKTEVTSRISASRKTPAPSRETSEPRREPSETRPAPSAEPRRETAKRETPSSSSLQEKRVEPIRVRREDITANPIRVTRDDIERKSSESRIASSRHSDLPERSSRQAREITSVIRSERSRSDEPSRGRIESSALSRRTETRGSDHSRWHQPSGGRERGYRDSDSRIVINGDNNVIVQGNVSHHQPRPWIPRRLTSSTVFVSVGSGWHDYGSYFSFRWSNSSLGRVACLPYRRHYGFSYYYPRYHRKYVFVSLGGYWPYEYRYRRYYWYGCHPHYWYGSHVIPSQPKVEYNTYNTYNYYGQTTTTTSSGSLYDEYASDYRYPFGNTKPDLSGLFDEVSVPADAPEYESPADLCFANAVELFGDGSFEAAANQFRDAVSLSPDDVIMPFAYSQALFAEGSYAHAASVLRTVMAALPDDELTIYYPRGLYEKEEVLLAQVAELEKAIAVEPFNSDFQLLLGYQYVGLGELDKAAAPLSEAARDPANEPTAAALMELAARLEKEQAENGAQ